MTSTREARLLSNASVVFDEMSRAPAELHQTRDTISTPSKELARVAQLKSSIKSIEDNVVVYEASKDELKKELAAVINDSAWLSKIVDDICAEMVYLRERLGARYGVIWSIVDDLCPLLGPSF